MQQQRPQEEPTTHVPYIRSVSSTARRYRHFGALLAEWRTNAGVPRRYVIECLPQYCTREGLARLRLVQPRSQADVKPLNEGQYGKLERAERRAPKFDELLPLYVTLTIGCGAEPAEGDREAYIELARAAIEPKIHHCEDITSELWQALADQLALADGLDPDALKADRAEQLWHEAYTSSGRATLVKVEDEQERHLSREVLRILRKDTSHILERDAWIEQMLNYWEEGKRLVAIQAISGAGKTRALYVLLKRLVALPNNSCWPFFYTFQVGAGKMPDDYLDSLLVALRTDLKLSSPEEKVSREEGIEQVLLEVQRLDNQGKRVSLLLDDVQVVLDPLTGEFSAAWQSFLDAFVSDEHHAMLYLATREWPHWHMRERSFLVETELEKLSPEAGTLIWQRLGFSDVAKDLLYRASKKCDGNPQLIELGASSLDRPRHVHLWSRSKGALSHQRADNRHAERLRAWLDDDTVFAKTDIAARKELAQVLSERIPQHTYQLLDLLAIASLPLPFVLIEEVGEHPELAFDALARCSLVSREAAEEGRAGLVSLAREARVHELSQERKGELESLLTTLYERWLYDVQEYQDESEMSSLVSELAIIHLKQHRLLEAAGLLIEYGWLSFSFGNGPRLARVADEAMAKPTWRDGDKNEIGGVLLYHYLGQYAGRVNKTSKRAEDYRHIVAIARAKRISLHVATEIQIFHYQLLAHLNQSQFLEAKQLLDGMNEQLELYEGSLASIPLLSDIALFYGTWGDHAKEVGDRANETARREQAIAAHRQAITILEQQHWDNSPLTTLRIRKNMARQLNNLSCYLVDLNRHEEAVPFLHESINIKRELHVLPYSLAAGLGELAMALVASGQYQEALRHCEEALQLVQEAADAGNSIAHAELPIYKVNKARILVRIGQWEDAEKMIKDAEKQGIREERRIYKTYAKNVLGEIQGCRQAALVLEQQYLDWRWLQRYRKCIDYDVFGWLSHSGPFTTDEQVEWNRLLPERKQETAKQAMASLMKKARDRELAAAKRERREPCLCYPAIPVEELAIRTQQLEQLARDIENQEPNVVVKRLYLDAIVEQLAWFYLVNATAHGDNEAFWHYSRELYTQTQPDEMKLALSHLGALITSGKKQEQTASVSQTLTHYLQEWQLFEYANIFSNSEDKPSSFSVTHTDQRKVSPQAAKRFFEEVFRIYHIPNWQVTLDRAANNLRIEQNTRELILADTGTLSVARVRELLSHEIECHVLRSVRGELSTFGLLGLGTRGSLIMEEGLALYFDDQTARKVHGTVVDDSTPSTWMGTLAVGLACGILTSPRSFAETLPFFEQIYYLVRLLTDEAEDKEKAYARAARLALNRCLRTYRGVPDLNGKGVCLTKDVVYLRGFCQLRARIQEDASVIDRLLVGVVGLEQLSDLTELEIVYPEVRQQWLAHRPDLDQYILSFSNQNT